jgi:hypothetical protein
MVTPTTTKINNSNCGSWQCKCIIFLLLPLVMIQNVQCGWVDPDTNEEHLTTTALTKSDEREYQLVS